MLSARDGQSKQRGNSWLKFSCLPETLFIDIMTSTFLSKKAKIMLDSSLTSTCERLSEVGAWILTEVIVCLGGRQDSYVHSLASSGSLDKGGALSPTRLTVELPLRHFGTEPLHAPLWLQNKVSLPTSEYPCLQLNLYWDPSTEPLPFTKPFDIDEGRTGQSENERVYIN